MITYVHTDKVNNYSNDIITIANRLSDEINNLYKRLSDVPSVTKEWIGGKANYYFNTVYLDKKKYIDFIEEIRSIGYKFKNDSEKIKNRLNKDK